MTEITDLSVSLVQITETDQNVSPVQIMTETIIIVAVTEEIITAILRAEALIETITAVITIIIVATEIISETMIEITTEITTEITIETATEIMDSDAIISLLK